ncbi:MAG: DNA helicase RecQ [Bacteroidetes bacterium]|nr:MAG: DNA helicase RecQ [Bacteroidota bacterium]
MQYREDVPLISQLSKWFGFDAFKGNQEAIIRNLLQGHDTFVLMPTGGGKSLCYQLPALILDGVAIVVSPLIALMKNQVDLMRGYSEKDGIAHFLNSSLNRKQIAQVKSDISSGKTKLLYVAPESLNKEDNIEFLRTVSISFYAIDEAHCISEWGHDFRPEYRRLRQIINEIGQAPVIALTATATPKVQSDIQKNLGMADATLFKSSFNRPNLYYEVRPKANATRDILTYIKDNPGKSGIIYCLSRKKVEQMAEVLQVNGVRALPYHAGMDPATRGKHQDAFLQEEVEVIVATIAFGMGIDKPDVRYVIHYDMPKSLEGYYQETGRAGRDGGEGRCIAFYSKKDMHRLEHFMQNKSISEQEIGKQLLLDTVHYAQGGDCRRVMLLQYFGERYEKGNCGTCDNCNQPQERFDGEPDLLAVLNLLQKIGDGFRGAHLLHILMGEETPDTKLYENEKLPEFGSGSQKGKDHWDCVIRQAVVHDFIMKDIQQYGQLYLTDKGRAFISDPYSIRLVKDHKYDQTEKIETGVVPEAGAVDNTLFSMLKNLCQDEAKKRNIPPFVIFQDASLQEMTIHYPTKIDDLQYISGVSMGKARRYGKPFVELIKQYVEDNDIIPVSDMVVKVVPKRSQLKLQLISSIDRKMNLEDIAEMRQIDMDELLHEIEQLVSAGTKLDIGYYVDENVEDDIQEDVYDYFKNDAESDSLEEAQRALKDMDVTEEELRLVRIRFISEMAN